MIVMIQIQRLLVNVSQPLLLTLMFRPETAPTLELTPYHLKKNRMMKNAMAAAPTIWSARRRRLMSKLIAGFPLSRWFIGPAGLTWPDIASVITMFLAVERNPPRMYERTVGLGERVARAGGAARAG